LKGRTINNVREQGREHAAVGKVGKNPTSSRKGIPKPFEGKGRELTKRKRKEVIDGG